VLDANAASNPDAQSAELALKLAPTMDVSDERKGTDRELGKG
jgi:hypothetical protein